MNTQLYNELIEAKGNNTLGVVLKEKFASLNINTEEEAQYLFDYVNEKTAGFGNTSVSPLVRVIAGLSLAGIAAVPIGKMIANAATKKSTFTKVIDSNPDLKNDPKKTKEHYDMLWHVAPNLASNHVIASSVLQQLKAYDMIDHQMIAKLVEADKNMADSRSKTGPLATAVNISTAGNNLSSIAGAFGKGGGSDD
jgi:hypothetical protein